MGRPLYETKEQRAREFACKDMLEERFERLITKLPMRYKVDWIVWDKKGGPLYVIEHKARDIELGQYDEIMLSLDKAMAGRDLADYLMIPFYFLVEFTDCTKMVRLDNAKYSVRWSGRSRQTRDWQDVEPCVMIPHQVFQEVEL